MTAAQVRRHQPPVQYRDRQDRLWSVSEVAVLKVVSPVIDGPNVALVIRFEREGAARALARRRRLDRASRVGPAVRRGGARRGAGRPTGRDSGAGRGRHQKRPEAPIAMRLQWIQEIATATATVSLIAAGTIAAGTYTATVTATSAGLEAAIATFQVGVLWALGDVKVTTQTSGIGLDPDGYVIQLDSPWDYELEATGIAANGTVVLRGLTATSHVLTLFDVAANCTGEKLIQRPITVAANKETAVVVKLDCK